MSPVTFACRCGRARNRSGGELLKKVVHDFGTLGERRPDLMPVNAFGDTRAAVANQTCNVFEADIIGAQQTDEGVPEFSRRPLPAHPTVLVITRNDRRAL